MGTLSQDGKAGQGLQWSATFFLRTMKRRARVRGEGTVGNENASTDQQWPEAKTLWLGPPPFCQTRGMVYEVGTPLGFHCTFWGGLDRLKSMDLNTTGN